MSHQSAAGIPAIFGLEGQAVTAEEQALFQQTRPFGFILFTRNVDHPDQVRGLVAELKSINGCENSLVFIDQEGGRVARLQPPHWPEYPSAARFGALWRESETDAKRAAYLNARLIADDVAKLGIDCDCLPVLDIRRPGAHDVIGSRAYGDSVAVVKALARSVCDGVQDSGILPVIKHIPGHGRAMVDSHDSLPVVDVDAATLAETDFAPFKAFADAPMAMTAHLQYTAIDPVNPATLSKKIINDVIRHQIGFDGALMTDDLNMQALAGTLGDRASKAQAAGCDLILHCSGVFDEMSEVAENVEPLANAGLARIERVYAARRPAISLNRKDAVAERDALMAGLGEQA